MYILIIVVLKYSIRMKQAPFWFACLLLLSLTSNVFSQDLQPKSVASPEVATLGKFGEIPISNYTGVPDISIPLYTIEQDGLQIPVTLRYHSSGVKVEDESTWVGLNFDLSVGGSVTQIMNQMSDQESVNYNDRMTFNELAAEGAAMDTFYTTPYRINPICLGGICEGQQRTLQGLLAIKNYGCANPDKYTFNIPGGSGEFILDTLTGAPIITGNVNGQYYITKENNPDPYILVWTVKDIQGNTFYFSAQDNENSDRDGIADNFNGITSKLTSITLPNGNAINFRYKNGKYYTTTFTKMISWDAKAGTKTEGGGGFITEFRTKYLSEIETEKELIVFELSTSATDRQDIRAVTMPDGTHGVKRLNAIHIWDKITNKKIRSINFTYDYFACDQSYFSMLPSATDYLTKRLKLVSVQEVGYEQDGSPKLKPPYAFTYNETNSLPRKDSYARDHWGYFNGKLNTSFLPDLTTDILGGIFTAYKFLAYQTPDFVIRDLKNEGTANKGMSPTYSKAGILTQITYPTGGYSQFEYEENKFKNQRVFSAAEIVQGEGHINFSFADVNTSQSNATSGYFEPNEEDVLLIDNLLGGFAKVDPNLNNTYMLGSNIVLKRLRNDSITVVKSWGLNTNANTGEITGWQFGPEYLRIPSHPGDKYFFVANLPDISQLTPQNGSLIPVASAGCTFSRRDTATLSKESIGGGLRIKSVKAFESSNNLVEETQYKYVNSDGTSSGILMSGLRNYSYMRYMFDYTLFVDLYQIASYSYIPLSSDAQGAVVGYSRVEVSKVSVANNANNIGKTVYYFKNKAADVLIDNSYGRFGSSTPNVPHYDNGLVDSVEYYNTASLLLKKSRTTYTLLKNLEFINTVIIYDLQYGAMITEDYCYANCDSPEGHIVLEVGNPIANFFLGLGQDLFPKYADIYIGVGGEYKKWVAIYVPTRVKWFVPVTTTEIIYNSTPLTTKSTSTYNLYGQLKEKQSTTSKGETTLSAYKYANDFYPDVVIQALVNKKMYGIQLEATESLKPAGGSTFSELSKSQMNYQINSNGNVKLLNSKKSFRGSALFDVVTNVKYDNEDNILQYEKNGVTTSFMWGYNLTYPVAKVDNATTTTQVNNITSNSVTAVLKTTGAQQPYVTQFNVGRSGNATVTMTMNGTSNTNEIATVNCVLTSSFGQSAGFISSFNLCLGTGTYASSCGGVSTTFNLGSLLPGMYSLSATLTSETNVSIGKGRNITVSYPDISLTYTGTEFYYQNYEDIGTAGTAHTGKKYTTSTAVSWTKPNTRSYVISYWYRLSGVWKYSGEIAYTGSSYTMSGGDAYDDVRIHPKDAQMTTYTFEPSVGMTSMTDATGMTTYFEFDAFGRFKLARDANSNIIKNYVYNYKLTPTNN
jgi:hypothetical protein